MSSTAANPFRRIGSLVRRGRQETPYLPCEEDAEEETTAKPVVEFSSITASSPEPSLGQDRVLKSTTLSRETERTLVECFYLGSSDMTGLEIKGRGCIDSPAATIWNQSQHQEKPKRKPSWSSKQQNGSTPSNSLKPRYVKLVTGESALLVVDYTTDELIIKFDYRKISFVGTHPKYTRLFAFIAESSEVPVPFCHAFKCEDRDSAKQTACSLADVFHKKIQEILKKSIVDNTNTVIT